MSLLCFVSKGEGVSVTQIYIYLHILFRNRIFILSLKGCVYLPSCGLGYRVIFRRVRF